MESIKIKQPWASKRFEAAGRRALNTLAAAKAGRANKFLGYCGIALDAFDSGLLLPFYVSDSAYEGRSDGVLGKTILDNDANNAATKLAFTAGLPVLFFSSIPGSILIIASSFAKPSSVEGQMKRSSHMFSGS